jgi:cytochrome oxidase Cu insertion factor (SCO1/SenC/PrrC family)
VKLITGLLAFLAVLSSPLSSRAAEPYEALSAIRIQPKTAPEFSLPQVNGTTMRLSDFKGKFVLLGFFKTF